MRTARLAATPAASLLFVLALTSLVGQALTVPAVARLAGLPAARPLDYIRQVGTFAPLSDAFVRRALGLPALSGPPGVTGSYPLQGPGRGGADSLPSSREDPPITAQHAFNNDDFNHAYAVPGLPFTASTDTTGQTRQTGEPSSCSATGGTAWYRYTPSRDQTLFADTFGTTYADALGIFTGRSLDGLRQVGCASSATGDAQVGFLAHRGTTYWFQIGGTVAAGRLLFHLLPIGTTQQLSAGTKQELPAVSTDGHFVAFAGFPPGPMTGARACRSHPWCAALFLADLRTGLVTILVSLHADATSDNNFSPSPEPVLGGVAISADGRYVGFGSDDPELVTHDANDRTDVFVFDRVTGGTERVSIASDGSEAHTDQVDTTIRGARVCTAGRFSGSFTPSLSANGRFVAFNSDADNLDKKDTNGCVDVFVHDRLTGRTELASIGEYGYPFRKGGEVYQGPYISGDGRSVVVVNRGTASQAWVYDRLTKVSAKVPGAIRVDSAVISADGTRIAYLYYATTAPGGVAQAEGLAIFDRRTGRTTQVGGPQGGGVAVYQDGASTIPALSISATGRYVAFSSTDSTLVPGDTNEVQDIFVYDTVAKVPVRVSTTSTGGQYTINSAFPSISGDGRTIAFVQGGESFAESSASDIALLVHHSVRAGAP